MSEKKEKQHHVIVYRTNNTPGKVDAREVFVPGAKKLKALLEVDGHVVHMVGIDTRTQASKSEFEQECLDGVLDACRRAGKVRSLSFFCHGFRKRVELFPRGKNGAKIMSRLCANFGVKLLNLFACSTAKPGGDGNWCRYTGLYCGQRQVPHGIQIMGHGRAAHGVWNPYKVFTYVNSYDGEVIQSRFCKPGQAGYKKYRRKIKGNWLFCLNLPYDNFD
jgi:hypothetical protein